MPKRLDPTKWFHSRRQPLVSSMFDELSVTMMVKTRLFAFALQKSSDPLDAMLENVPYTVQHGGVMVVD